ncbi:MAG TPA: membrane dipeptidase [Chloroflexota bacterium]|nr:membrane dipeptidase [Chloroflexota bacterium]
MLAFDLHLDLALSALTLNRDLTLSIADCRASEAGIEGRNRGHNTVTFPELRRGHVGLCIATVLGRVAPGPGGGSVFRSHELAYASAMGMLAYYRQLERQGICRIVTTAPQLAEAAAAWSTPTPPGEVEAPLTFLIGTEGCDCIVSPSQLDHWWDAGLRSISLVHFNRSQYAGGTGSDTGLTDLGRDLLRAMDERGAILDVTHQSDPTFWESLSLFKGPLFASHQNARALVPGPRQFTDDQLKALVERDAVVGHALDAWQLYPDYVRGQTPKSAITLDHVVRQIDHLAQLAGTARHSAIGSDMDGLFGYEQTPQEVDTIADLQKLPPLLAARGYTPADITGIMHGNALRFFTTHLPPS